MARTSKPSSGQPIAPPVLRRLAQYLSYVQSLCDAGIAWVSSRELATELGLTSSTVRQDLSHIRFAGLSRRGYRTEGLREALVRDLGMDRPCGVIIVGAGNVGRALAAHKEFPRRGFLIRGVFDCDPRVIGQRVGSLTVRSMEELDPFVAEEGIEIGILAVPATAAQEVADRLTRAGIRGLLNLAPTHVRVTGIPVVDVRLVHGLVELAYRVRFRTMGLSISPAGSSARTSEAGSTGGSTRRKRPSEMGPD